MDALLTSNVHFLMSLNLESIEIMVSDSNVLILGGTGMVTGRRGHLQLQLRERESLLSEVRKEHTRILSQMSKTTFLLRTRNGFTRKLIKSVERGQPSCEIGLSGGVVQPQRRKRRGRIVLRKRGGFVCDIDQRSREGTPACICFNPPSLRRKIRRIKGSEGGLGCLLGVGCFLLILFLSRRLREEE
ncbi:hypothetical protein KP509_24G019800 [Ceratopteris richardii]|uniref:Uncharacterized protein n=1 Tax=Ceratopteris richardii TaxID=49495 RepID=A0A8T2RVZ3_CERRI|nr:hypothetical protein KP509_24G019800 [Ceratopteris richardii]